MLSTLAHYPFVIFALQLWHNLPISAQIFVVLIAALLLVACVGALVESFRAPIKERHLDGFRLVSRSELAKKTVYPDKKRRHLQIMLGQVPWPAELEDKHLLIDGTTGVGKSTLIQQILPRIRARGGRAIVVDLNGDFAAKFLTPRDKIFNPFDKRSVRWNPLAEIRQAQDIDSMLQAMIPTGTTPEDENWRGYARQFLKTLMMRLREEGELRMDRVRYYAIAAGDKELAAFLQGGSNPTRLQDNSMVSNTKTLVKNCVESLDYASAEASFSIQNWVREGEGFIFITPKDKQRKALAPLVNTFMNLAVLEARSPPDGKSNKPIALIIDELASFDFDDLQDVLEKGRKFGLVAIAGIQNVAQLRQKYGPDGASILMSCFLSKVIFNPGDAVTGEAMADEIGKHEVERLEISKAKSSDGRTTVTKFWRAVPPKHLVSSDELRKLPPLHAYVKFTGDYPVAKITLSH